ncbi:conserved hypothetical protein [Paraburkholderia tropica]|uniref:T6SS effector phospholipase Tle3 domain-containing protein n=1 Tax=Paraburkholderia tropica TaxID=92647 RepID=UPI001CB2C19B|nr:DUF3274 domain-containing protein [Paraburkholderia tropica]CAG9193594.1 conserved hypothetical protein [Paraburkholderia tropica]
MFTSNLPLMGQTEALFYPGASPAFVQVQQPKPCITILVHGVNDLAGIYADIEQGLCDGLNDRLDHLTNARGQFNVAALVSATYSLPTDDDHLAKDPDKVYYRRLANTGKGGTSPRSVVIPFYWGFREDSGKDPKTKLPYVQKDTPHGEWLDRYGNRLDKAATKEGGAFANATTTLPDMWLKGFNDLLFGFLPMNVLAGTPRHPLFAAPPRNYMLLAAKRLAMLVRIIRAKHPDDTVNVVAHSQGTMLALLANAFLKDEGQRPIDSAVLMNSPYSLFEPLAELTQLYAAQQTRDTRVSTLSGILHFIGDSPHTVPALADVADPGQFERCIGGLRWTGMACATTLKTSTVGFDERDNRGSVTLYFTPLDQTVGLRNVQGIGWQGVPDEVLAQLGQRFHQRIFTVRERDGISEEVGAHPPGYRYVMRQPGESTWDGNGQGFTGNAKKSELDVGQAVTLNAPVLPEPFKANFDSGGTADFTGAKDGIHMVKAAMDPIEASIGLTYKGWKPGVYRDYELGADDPALAHGNSREAVQAALNQDKETFDLTQVRQITQLESGKVRVTRLETPSDARRRMMETPNDQLTKDDALSFHSAIPSNPEHSRKAVAYDLAIGQARSIDDEVFYAYLCRVADWRLGWGKINQKDSGVRHMDNIMSEENRELTAMNIPSSDVMENYSKDAPENKLLIDATADYFAHGRSDTYPEYFTPDMPSLVTTETRSGRNARRG